MQSRFLLLLAVTSITLVSCSQDISLPATESGAHVLTPKVSTGTIVGSSVVQKTTPINPSINLEVDSAGCKQRVLRGSDVLVPDLVAFITEALPKATIGEIDEGCHIPENFQQIRGTSHILFRLPTAGKEHASFGDMYILSLEDKKVVALDYFNKLLREKRGILSLSPDTKQGIFLDLNDERTLHVLKFDQKIYQPLKTLPIHETWNASTSLLEGQLQAFWQDEANITLAVFDGKAHLDGTPKLLRMEKIQVK